MTQGQFHINSNGDLKPCKATKNRCQFGDETLHFKDVAQGRAFVEKIYSEGLGANALSGKKSSSKELLTRAPGDMPELQVKMVSAIRKSNEPKLQLQEFTERNMSWRKRFFLKPEVSELTINGESYPVINDRRKSGFLCKACGRQLTKDTESEILSYAEGKCSCGESTGIIKNQPMGVFADTLWMLDPKTYEKNKIYHVTDRESWAEDIRSNPELKIHFGCEESADARRIDRQLSDPKSKKNWRMFSAKLKDTPDIKILLSDDLEDSWESISADGEFVVYLNRWEAPGSLSVMTTQRYLSIGGDFKAY